MDQLNNNNRVYGLLSFILGFISIFFLAPVFSALAILMGIIGCIKKHMGWSIAGIILAVIGLYTSPIMWMLTTDDLRVDLKLNGTVNGKKVDGLIQTENQNAPLLHFKID